MIANRRVGNVCRSSAEVKFRPTGGGIDSLVGCNGTFGTRVNQYQFTATEPAPSATLVCVATAATLGISPAQNRRNSARAHALADRPSAQLQSTGE
jgi:hypothetical protein